MEQIQRKWSMVTEKEFLKVINNKDKGPKPYDTTAEVVRVEDGVAWVHIDGGVEETPAELTINAVKGDLVKVRLVGGQAYLIGNGTAPPTDDRVANNALGVANSAQLKALTAEEVALVTEQKTRPAITSMITYYKLSNGTPAQPTEADHDGWSEEEPLWDADSDEQLYYSVRYRTVENIITWTPPHVLSSYASFDILQNAILLEVGEGSTIGHLIDSNGEDILDSNDEPFIAKLGSITDAYARVQVKANEILQEVSETYVNTGQSNISSMSSVMKQTAQGVDIYATINGLESDTHTHIDNDSFDVVRDGDTKASFGESAKFFSYDSEDNITCLIEIQSYNLVITNYNVWDPEEGLIDERTAMLDATQLIINDVWWQRRLESLVSVSDGKRAAILMTIAFGGILKLMIMQIFCLNLLTITMIQQLLIQIITHE